MVLSGAILCVVPTCNPSKPRTNPQKLFFAIAASCVDAIPQLYAAVGGKVSLPCNTSITAGGDGVSLILWYHGDYGIPIYSLDARDQTLGKARQFGARTSVNPAASEVGWKFEGKPLYSNVKQGIIISNQSLVLQKVRRESRGHYQCDAANVEGEGESDRLLLRVHCESDAVQKENIAIPPSHRLLA
ncbi:hypothetical protein MTO96_005583 [Rhipicephalus appendiculatus]